MEYNLFSRCTLIAPRAKWAGKSGYPMHNLLRGQGTPRQTVVLVYYANPQYTPPVLNIIHHLAETFRVIVVARNHLPFDHRYPDNVTLYKVGHYLDQNERAHPAHRKILDHLAFIIQACRISRREHPIALVALDVQAMPAAWMARRLVGTGAVWIYHQNETSLLSEIPGRRFAHWLKRLELQLIRAPDVISFPEPNRAKRLLAEARVDRAFVLMQNCPRRLLELPRSVPALTELRRRGRRVVLYHGAIGTGIDLDIAIRSIPIWPADSVLVVLGYRSPAQKQFCENAAEEEGILDRLILLPFVPHSELLEYVSAADLGLVLYRPGEINTRYAAPTKLYEYFACGVPVVVPAALPHVSAMVSQFDVGMAYTEATAKAIGAAVTRMLESPHRSVMGQNARRHHLATLNFEVQFAPLLQAIQSSLVRVAAARPPHERLST